MKKEGYNTLVLSLATHHPCCILHRRDAEQWDMQTNNGESQLVPNGSIKLQSGNVPRRSSPDQFRIWESDVFPG
jgi:hypothetical protein